MGQYLDRHRLQGPAVEIPGPEFIAELGADA
jgi:hypothetical protein